MKGNITESPRKSTSNNLKTDNQAKFDETLEFISLIVHDLQGPIASMKTLTKFLVSAKYNPENDMHAALVRSSKNALERTEAIIQDLLDSASQGNFGFRLNVEPCDLREIIKDSIDALSGSAFDYGVSMTINLPKKPMLADVDRYYLVRVVDNLIFNALKHSSRGRKVLVNLKQQGPDHVISIDDEGSGLNDTDKESIFDKYQQVSLRKSGKYRGVGLGLYFCKQAILAMNGKIWVDSNKAKGASFKIALPARENG